MKGAWPAARAALLALCCAGAAGAQPIPAGQGLRLSSSPEALADPTARRCRELAGRRTDPNADSVTTQVERAGAQLELPLLFEGVSACRAALRLFPTDPNIVIAHFTATETLLTLVLGVRFPDAPEQQLQRMLEEAKRRGAPSGFEGQLYGFALGSAYEHGVGTAPNRAEALRWYRHAAEAGDAISRRELERLERASP